MNDDVKTARDALDLFKKDQGRVAKYLAGDIPTVAAVRALQEVMATDDSHNPVDAMTEHQAQLQAGTK